MTENYNVRGTTCAGCHQPLLPENAWMEDGCPCNTPRGVNDGNQLISQWRAEEGNRLRIDREELLAACDAFLETMPHHRRSEALENTIRSVVRRCRNRAANVAKPESEAQA